MKRCLLALGSIAAILLSGGPAGAGERYGSRPPVLVSPDLAAPWVMQLESLEKRRTVPAAARASREVLVQPAPARTERNYRVKQRAVENQRARQADEIRTASTGTKQKQQARPEMDPIYLPQQVEYETSHPAGTIVIDTAQKFLYLVQGNGQARRYGVGVGKDGMLWSGTETISRKAEWPDWRPPAEMIARERAKGKHLPTFMAGGPANPLGARALYLGSTLYRIHGTNAPWTIGTNVSSGCIRLRNEDVVDLYERVDVGSRVVVM